MVKTIFSVLGRQKLQAKEKRWVALLALRSTGFIFAIISLSLVLGSAFAKSSNYTAGYGIAIVGITYISVLSWSAFVHLLNILFFLLSSYPLHPVVNIIFDLIAWFALLWPGVGSALGLSYFYYRSSTDSISSLCAQAGSDNGYSSSPYYTNDGSSSSSSTYSSSDSYGNNDNTIGYTTLGYNSSSECNKALNNVFALQIAAIVFLFLDVIIHFILWVWACRRAHTRRMDRKRMFRDAAEVLKVNRESTNTAYAHVPADGIETVVGSPEMQERQRQQHPYQGVYGGEPSSATQHYEQQQPTGPYLEEAHGHQPNQQLRSMEV